MDLDDILKEIGEFGKFQSFNYFLLCLPIIFCASNSLSFIFTAKDTNYRYFYNVLIQVEREINNSFKLLNRCFVEECESIESAKYDANFVKDVLPGKISESSDRFIPEHCMRYKFDNATILTNRRNGACEAHWFDHEKIPCNKWVFEEGERTIINDVSKFIRFKNII